MHNRISKKPLILALLAGAAFCAPGQAMAQQLTPDWTPLDDAGPSGNGYGGDESQTDESRRSKRGRGKRKGPRVDVTPYLEVQQVAIADLKNGGEVLTYSTVAAGVDASVSTRRAEAQVNVRYERLIAYDGDLEDQDTVSGLARGSVKIARGFSLEAGGIATRSKIDGRGPSPTNLVGNPDNVTQVYSVYAGPSFSTNVKGLNVNASYQAGFTKVESRESGTLPPGQQPFSTFDESISHSANASIGMQPGALPVGWSVGVGYDREDADQLDNRFESKFARADVTVPIGNGLAVIGGVGYEEIEVSERDALRDGAGDPVTDADGRLVTDPNSPRLVAYREDGVIWDVGLAWRPSSRTSLSGYYGQRYGSDTFGANLTYQPNETFAVNAAVYDQVSGFGGLLNDNLAALPTSFRTTRNPLTGDIGGCAFGQAGGNCFNDALQSVNSASFRSRGVTAALSSTRNGWNTGIAVGYNNRKFLTSDLGARADIAGLTDENYFALASLSRNIDDASGFDTSVYANYFDPGADGAPNVLGVGANAAYYRQLYRGLSATAAIGLDSYNQEDFDSDLTASALIGLRYSF